MNLSARFKFELAGNAEDEALRAILRQTFMPGRIALSFQREPDFFVAERAGNLEGQILAARDAASSRIVGFGCRSFRKVFVDGEEKIVGYLSNLRSLQSARGGTLLARAYRFLKELHEDGRAPFYLTTIFDDNEHAATLLTSQRAGLPVYQPLGKLYTYLLPLYRRRKKHPANPAIVKGVGAELLDEAVRCINSFNRRQQFGPCYTSADLLGATGLLPCFETNNLYVYQEQGHVTATIGVWDQNSFKQAIVSGYSWPYSLARPFSNLGARFGLSAKLPRVGEAYPYLYAALVSCEPGETRSLAQLLTAVLHDWSGRGYAYLLIGAHEESPLRSVLLDLSVMQLSSSIYLVYWNDKMDGAALPSTTRVPHLELATL